jgi:hypothetical protein|tara:strand:- start:304 stop:585 length:282 start_codon:yes stop_codon:yes gene_type:complete
MTVFCGLDNAASKMKLLRGTETMARKFITPMGRHKPLGSSWQSMDCKAYSRSYEPETRPEFRVYVTGQADAWAERYRKEQDKAEALAILDSLL